MGKTRSPVFPLTARTDHPHAGGENITKTDYQTWPHGPSPRGWGKPVTTPHPVKESRTIPTRVGKTARHRGAGRGIPDHPHAGGENKVPLAQGQSLRGPSPRGWGKHNKKVRELRRTRTIPTRVGKTCSLETPSTSYTDHPHAGGENSAIPTTRPCVGGPSPRGWGKRGPSAKTPHGCRTIPTRVGKTPPAPCPRHRTPDHPHAGGENVGGSPRRFWISGPSPRGWGKLSTGAKMKPPKRTIPTRVGKTAGRQLVLIPRADHPHAGGENRQVVHPERLHGGPSPRGWGKRQRFDAFKMRHRTIPTRVGKTIRVAPMNSESPDHPHAGGENDVNRDAQHFKFGPSPRGWGKRQQSQRIH